MATSTSYAKNTYPTSTPGSGSGGPLSPQYQSSSNGMGGHSGMAASPPNDRAFEVHKLSQSLDEAIGDLQPANGPASYTNGSSSNGREYGQGHAHAGSYGSMGRDPSLSNSANGRSQQPQEQTSSSAPMAVTPSQPRNPLVDLIETERGYIDDLALVIKRVAAAWSRSNFPPPALDDMFRAVEQVYRIDKQFMARLDEIGPTPASPKALGDLLMRWIDDLEPAYTRYVQNYKVDFDHFEPVQSNPNLHGILTQLPQLTTETAVVSETPYPTLDALFRLPLDRLDYFKRLYAKLLKSTKPGKGDHGLLISANEKLDWLLEIGQQSSVRSVTALPQGESGRSRTSVDEQKKEHSPRKPPGLPALNTNVRPQSETASNSGTSSVERSSGQTVASNQSTTLSSDTSAVRGASPMTTRLDELEKRLDTSRTLDIFTMKPKKCKLQMNPPNLPYRRIIRQSGDVQTSMLPASDPARREVFSAGAHIYLLTDLFLLCERIAPNETPANPQSDMWLMYPPLATKHLKVTRIDDADQVGNSFEVEIMRKERITVFAESRERRDEWIENFQEAIAFVNPAGPPSAGGLRVNTDVSRSTSPASAASNTSAGPSNRSNAFSPLSWQSGGTSNPSSLPPLPTSASAPHFPSGAGPDVRSQTPTSGSASPRRLPEAPYQDQGIGPRSASPHGSQQQPLQSPRGPAGMRVAPPGHGSLPPPITSPLSHSFSQPLPGRPLPPQPQFHNQQNQHHQSSSHSSYAPSENSQHQSIRDSSQSGHQQQHYQQNMLPPNQGPLRKMPSSQSVASSSSRGSSRPNGQAPFGGPVPPLPGKEGPMQGLPGPPHHAQQFNGPYRGPDQQQMNRRTDPGMAQQGLLSPSASSYSGHSLPGPHQMHRSRSAEGLREGHPHMPPHLMADAAARGATMPNQRAGVRSAPSSRMNSGAVYSEQGSLDDDDDVSPPSSPVHTGPVTTQIAAQMKCKIFVQSAHGQWKSLGTARLKLYIQQPTNQKQLVVEDKQVLISTIVLEDGVERVGKTGVAIELSDNGKRTGLVYMLQLKTEASATGLFQQFLLGSTRASALLR